MSETEIHLRRPPLADSPPLLRGNPRPEASPFSRLFYGPVGKLLDFFIENSEHEYYEYQLPPLSGVPQRSARRGLVVLVREGAIQRKRVRGSAYKYRFNRNAMRFRALKFYHDASLTPPYSHRDAPAPD